MSEFILKSLNKILDTIYDIIVPIFAIALYIVLFIVALPIYIIALGCLCVVWSFLLIRYLLTKKDNEQNG